MATITDHLYEHLVSNGIGRSPRTAGALPPIWRQPRLGTPAPGEGTNATERGTDAVIGLAHTGGLPAARQEKDWRSDVIDVWLRTTTWPKAEQLYAQIRAVTLDRSNVALGGITVMIIEEWRPLQLLDSDEQSFTAQHALLIQTKASDHF